MGFDARRIAAGFALFGAGLAVPLAWRHGIWGTLTGALLVAAWSLSGTGRRRGLHESRASDAPTIAPPPRLLLDAAPTPLVAIEQGGVRVLNRAARRLFATDDRVIDPPAMLLDPDATHLRHEARGWRIDRVMLGKGMVAALIDIEQEERAAEARAAAELIQVLGHELLNGLAPIASLAESGAAAVARADADPALLHEILSTLARRADGLLRFTEAYRSLARLPDPTLRQVPIADMLGDLARLFAGRWPEVALSVAVSSDMVWTLDRDQVSQAIWALLQNAAEASAAAIEVMVGGGEQLTITISDDGPGIDPEQATRIFRPFHTGKPDGTGIGLSLARQIAHAHGGSLTLAEPAPATFRLVLPCVRAQNR
ncbi:MAG: HAMP domain-containing sensor histidine kinase [Sphingomonas phyllosphaerae]